MREEELLGLLESGDYDQVSRALIYVEKQLEDRPSPKLITKLVELCSDSDPDIRNEAVQAAGFYWQLSEAFPVLAGILCRTDEDDLVLNSALFAISQLAQNKPDLRNRGLSLLAQVAITERMPKMVRGSAYALALRLAGRISMDAFARMSVSSDVVIDKEYMSSLCSSSTVPN